MYIFMVNLFMSLCMTWASNYSIQIIKIIQAPTENRKFHSQATLRVGSEAFGNP